MTKARTWKRIFGASAIAVLFGATVAHAQSTQTPASDMKASQAAGGGNAAAGALSRADQRLLREMAQANLAEIEAGRIAQDKSQNEQVKNFARQMVDDHTKALQEVQQLAQSKGVTLPNEPDRQHKRMGQRLSALSGDAFDRRYMRQAGVDDHKKSHKLLQRVQSRAADADLKALAARLQPTVDQHLNSVEQLNAAIGKGAGATSSGTSGTAGGSGAGGGGSQGTKPAY